jgi:antibiotic biosynthesis monooxygenase (ABM) superfamily enzyme
MDGPVTSQISTDMESPMGSADEPVTVIVTRLVREGSEAAFEDAVKAFIPKALSFPGHLGVHMLRPLPGERDFGAVLKFRAQQDWAAFQQSPEYLSFLVEIAPYLEKPPGVETLCGLESWFTPIGARTTRVPPRWKMAFVTWIGVCLVVYLANVALAPLKPVWPAWLLYLLINALVVVGLTWAVMPVLNGMFRPWLLPTPRTHNPKESLPKQ